jgi:hypothetical protein
MPKCINDSTKSYKGDEPSPKGLGYSASSEEEGKILKGLDGSYWTVKQTATCKRWVKYKFENFDNIPSELYHNAYLPQTKEIKITDETGLENKFGGSKPFFVKGETWPMYKYVPMIFFCQFRDPRKDDNILYRVFFPFDYDQLDKYEYTEPENGYISKIELNKDNLEKQIIIPKPKCDLPNLTKCDLVKLTNFKPFIINDWKLEKELKHYDLIKRELNISNDQEKKLRLYDSYFDNKFTPYSSVKIGGTPMYCQSSTSETNFFQLTDCKWMPYGWGDSGIAHIYEDCSLEWDCC